MHHLWKIYSLKFLVEGTIFLNICYFLLSCMKVISHFLLFTVDLRDHQEIKFGSCRLLTKTFLRPQEYYASVIYKWDQPLGQNMTNLTFLQLRSRFSRNYEICNFTGKLEIVMKTMFDSRIYTLFTICGSDGPPRLQKSTEPVTHVSYLWHSCENILKYMEHVEILMWHVFGNYMGSLWYQFNVSMNCASLWHSNDIFVKLLL